ncbi:hypothetical protein POTOM_031328 [Populus tomentosa]|uniref:Pentatricopeptide repeat-containing protein n=1 Tax=Populus tomentosa TaxID=118781 RepID=A0A8X8CRI8_POPTO|nr:hypothetical protein POTOM_031328 [Populus tomentosa]
MNFCPSPSVFSSLVDSMGRAGRLETSMKSYTKAEKLDTASRLWDEMKIADFNPNFGLYTLIIESRAKSGKLDIAMSIFRDMEKAGFLPTPSTCSSLLEMHSASGQLMQL